MSHNRLAACHGCPTRKQCGVLSRRKFLAAVAGAASSAPLAASTLHAPAVAGHCQEPVDLPLRLQPVLSYEIPKRREQTSYRQWGGLQTVEDLADEQERIGRELASLTGLVGTRVDMLPLAAVRSAEEAASVARGRHDATIIYGAGGSVRILEALTDVHKSTILFLRHRSGPTYLWYEIAHPRYLRKTVDQPGQGSMSWRDVVVDSQPQLAMRLRALHGLHNTLGKRVVAVGGASGWGAGGRSAPEVAARDWKLDIRTVSYEDLGSRIAAARADGARVRRCAAQARDYLRQPGVTLETAPEFLDKAFLLADIFHDLLDEAQTDAITINQCMGTIMKISETTACMPLSLLNDAGYMAFCESDFVVIQSGILARYISRQPMFFNDPTTPHDGVVTLAHCTAQRKMDGKTPEAVRILTHFESDYGAAPKVEMRKGQRVTNLIPDFANKQWTGFEGEIVDAPFLPICRSQIDVSIEGSTEELLDKMKGFHWMTVYGSHLAEAQYALSKLGIGLSTLRPPALS